MSTQLFRNITLVDQNFNIQGGKQAMVVDQGQIAWIGLTSKIPKKLKVQKEHDLESRLVIPSFVECHTHTLFAGSRADEFEMRNQGASYLEIAEKGGGILSTMKATRKASTSNLLALTQARVNQFLAQGVSTLEIKTGYALDLKNELKCLDVIRQLKGPQIVSTFLGAHAKPPEFSSYELYLDYLAETVLPMIKKKRLSDRVDIFIEKGFFEKAAAEKYLIRAQEMGFQVTIHANQLSLSGGADLAVHLQAQSADHVIHLTEENIKSWASSNRTSAAPVAVLLPAADLYMKCAYPQARKLIDAGIDVALATDFNPGSCPTQDLSLVGLLARLEMKMTLPEVFMAYTYGAAKALNRHLQEGRLTVGRWANFISTEASLTDFFYSAGAMPSHDLFIRGKKINLK